jgi:hypothetical protein
MQWRKDRDDDKNPPGSPQAVEDRPQPEPADVEAGDAYNAGYAAGEAEARPGPRGAATGTDVTDADRDGVPDRAESDAGTRADTAEDATTDVDKDGVPDRAEAGTAAGVAPAGGTTTDADRDGVPDRVEADRDTPTTAGAAAVAADQSQPGQAPDAPRPDARDVPDELVSAAEAEQLRGRWRDIQSSFVDDPRRAVQDADDMVATALTTVVERFEAQRRALTASWRDGDTTDTEALRVALRRYRVIMDFLTRA